MSAVDERVGRQPLHQLVVERAEHVCRTALKELPGATDELQAGEDSE